MKVAIACDHGALELKEALIPFIRSLGHSVRDFGTHSSASCDYPDYAAAAALSVADGDCDKGIVLCTTGIGVSIAANKVDGIRCALLSDVESAKMTRLHNDTNMMAMGAAVVSQSLAFSIVETWLSTPFSNEDRHQRRIDKVMDLERGQKKMRQAKRKDVRRCKRSANPISKAINFILCLLLVISLCLLPLANFITNMVDPEKLAQTLIESDILSSFLGGGEAPESSEPLSSSDPLSEDSSAGPAKQSRARAAASEDADNNSSPSGGDLGGMFGNLEVFNELFGSLGGLLESGIIDTEQLTSGLDINPEDLNTEQLLVDLSKSQLVEDLSAKLIKDTMDAAMSSNPEEYQSTITGESLKETINNNIEDIIVIVQNNLTEEAKANVDPEALKNAVSSAVAAIPTEELDSALENFNPAKTVSTMAQDPTIGAVLKIVKFVHTGALRAIVLLVIVALCILVAISRLPGIQGITSIGISAFLAGMSCGATYLLLSMPILAQLFTGPAAFVGDFILPIFNSLAETFKVCAVVYSVLGVGTIICTTLLRGFFGRIFDVIFSND
ncbi:MAG: ribose 5-phosphate isomerase B [Ruminococcaceae bacterium]|nr:ribose 5-phosphate isomerase B [Oscillospiraceae bacterium]